MGRTESKAAAETRKKPHCTRKLTLAERAKIERDAAAAEWAAAVAEYEIGERRRQKRIKTHGVGPADVKLVIGLARQMCGGIGPAGAAVEPSIKLIGRKLKEALRYLSERAAI